MGSMQYNFTGDKKAQFEMGIAYLKKLSSELGYDFYFYPEMIVTADDARKAAHTLESEKIDLVVLQFSSFSAGEVILPIAKLNTALAIWAVPEPNTGGVLGLNSFCNLNMCASIVKNYLKEHDIKYKWLFGSPGDTLFIDRFRVTVKALAAIKNMRQSRVALVGGIAPGFNDLYFDERKIQKLLGVEIQRNHEFSEIKRLALGYTDSEISEELKIVSSGYTRIESEIKGSLPLHARMYKAYREFASKSGYDALAISCWPKIQDEFQMLACSTLAKLNQSGIPSACEGDLPGAVSMLMLKYLTGDVSMLMDLVSFDERDESVQFWHCGSAAECYACGKGVCLERFYENEQDSYLRRPSVHNMVFKAQKATVMRFTGEFNQMFVLDGEFQQPDKPTYFGSAGWMGQMRLNRRAISARDFINTLLVTGFQHHYPVIPGDLTEELMECAAWLGLKGYQEVKYENYLQI